MELKECLNMTWHKYLWSEWQIVNEIGSGAYGTVYKIRREDASGVYFAALKVITVSVKDEHISVSLKDSKAHDLQEENDNLKKNTNVEMDKSQLKDADANSKVDYFCFAEEISKEISFMEKFKGNSNIVSYEDHRIAFDEESNCWVILLRMELLTSLAEYFGNEDRSEKDVVRLGIDICSALEICEKEGILHRDVKPGNIFVSDFGNFKLGDFGIAFITHNTRTMREPIGTHDYMAPEVVRDKIYNRTVDLYSLGLIMYRILNDGNAPFLPVDGVVTNQMRKEADLRRMNGEPLPKIEGIPQGLQTILLKACSYQPEDRFQTAHEMRSVLKNYARESEAIERIKQKASMNLYFSAAGDLD